MAIGINLTNSDFGIDFPNAYGRIVSASVMRRNVASTDPNKFELVIDLAIYASEEGANKEAPRDVAFDRVLVGFDPNQGGNFFENCYNLLLTKEKYSGCTIL